MNPYQHLVAEYARLLKEGKSYQMGNFPPAPRPDVAHDSPKVLIFSPHPDDECIVGGLALRLMREAQMNVINVAVTQGSKKERQVERFRELKAACNYLGFGLLPTIQNGLEKVTLQTREQNPNQWKESVQVIANILANNQPRIILVPHDRDWNGSHIGTHHLVMDALRVLPKSFECYVVETEFWGAMDTPNLTVELSPQDLGDLMTATSFHVGEVQRNPYHLLLPAWMQDNVRRGGELVGGQGGAAPDFTFATLYRLSKWSQGKLVKTLDKNRQISRMTNPAELFI
ncbi:MAG: bacillithiol biosynthesis deacetylase BshB1 [Pedosphaera sp.]|nr:bacillithiol biosynthesis deacetylase BshB1 [Pedosphaera sp.]